QTADEGIVIIRGDFQGEGRTDFAVAGTTPDSLLVLALFAESDGTFQTADVYAISKRMIPFAGTTPSGAPAIYLERALCEFRCASKSTLAIVPKFVGDTNSLSRTNLAWISRLHRFVSDEPVD